MGRRRRHDLYLPPLMYRKVRGGRERFYYGRAGTALGDSFPAALRKYAEIHGGPAGAGTFAEAATLYQREELAGKAPKTQDEYERQLATLVQVFGTMTLDAIRPKHIADFVRVRSVRRIEHGKQKGGPITATREKALLSAVLTFAIARGLFDGPNPCAGLRVGVKAKRDRYVTDAELAHAIELADQALAGFLELCYLTGQRPGDVVRMRRTDAQDGALLVRQAKTGAKVRIALVGPLQALYERLTAQPIGSMYLVRDERGQPFTLAALRKRFDKLGVDWQIRDLRAKAASDAANSRDAQRLLGHAAASTTDGYIRHRVGEHVSPIMRKVKR
jgi:integrase